MYQASWLPSHEDDWVTNFVSCHHNLQKQEIYEATTSLVQRNENKYNFNLKKFLF